ncbi:MAG: hypothetical protein ACR2FU_22980, partial [Streptosporangiaceae bacterium]
GEETDPEGVRPGPPTAGTHTPPRPSATSRPTPSASHRSFPGPALADAGHGQAAPPGFRPVSVTFVGNRGGYLGAVLGQAPCRGHTCTAMAGTATYGRAWTGVGAPPAGPSAVSQVRFADPANGWAYGPALWATHDGGKTWRSIGTHGGYVLDLAAVGNHAFAVIGHGGAGCGASSTALCNRFTLMSAAVTSDTWAPVPSGSGSGHEVAGGLQLTPRGGYLLAGGRLYAGPLTAGAWRAVPAAASGTPSCPTSPGADDVRLIAPGRGTLYLACGSVAGSRNLSLYASGDGGRTWQARGSGPVTAGAATSLAVSPGGTLVLATTTGLYYSSAAGSWRKAAGGSANDVAFRYIGMTTAKLGVAVPANPAPGDLFVTTDGGRTWQARPISR